MYTIILGAHTVDNAPFKKSRGFVNGVHGWYAYMSFSTPSLEEAAEKAEKLRTQFWGKRLIGDNVIAKYTLSVTDSAGVTKMFTEFTGRKTSISLTSN